MAVLSSLIIIIIIIRKIVPWMSRLMWFSLLRTEYTGQNITENTSLDNLHLGKLESFVWKRRFCNNFSLFCCKFHHHGLDIVAKTNDCGCSGASLPLSASPSLSLTHTGAGIRCVRTGTRLHIQCAISVSLFLKE